MKQVIEEVKENNLEFQNELEGYIVRVQKFKEKDAIVSILTTSGIKTIYGRGYKSLNSKYHVLNNLLLKIRMTGVDKKYYILQDFKILNHIELDYTDFDYISRIYDIIDLIFRTSLEYNKAGKEYIYSRFEEVIKNMNSTNYELIYLWFIGKVLKVNHINLSFDECVICGRKNNFYSFSFDNGGIICQDCFQKGIQTQYNHTKVSEIKSINYILNATIKEVEKVEVTNEIKSGVLYLLNETLGIYNKEK